jgi:hypothetical protein
VTRPLSAAERQRLRTPANLSRALIPLLVLVGALVLLTWPRGAQQDGVHVVDVTGPIAAANQQSGFTVLAPTGLDGRWRPTSTQLVPRSTISAGSLRIGFVSPLGKYAELLESDDAADAVAAQYGPLTADGSVAVVGSAVPAAGSTAGTAGHSSAGATTAWQAFRRPDGELLLRHTTGRVTAVVTGSAGPDELAQLAGSLR